MSAARKISEAEEILIKIQNTPSNFKLELENFVRTINDVFLRLLDEYNVKFGLGIKRIGFEKFKSIAKKAGKIDAINFLIWYEKEYKKLRDDPEFGKFLEKEFTIQEDHDIIRSCSALLDRVKNMTYYAYENF